MYIRGNVVNNYHLESITHSLACLLSFNSPHVCYTPKNRVPEVLLRTIKIPYKNAYT